jgi:fatty-acyl-CoA synthase
VEAVVYAVPDPVAGDQVMVAVVPADGFDSGGFARWVAEQPDCSPPWVPRFLRVVPDPPRTPTGKVIVRALAAERWDAADVWIRDDDRMRPMTDADIAALEKAFAASGRALL